MSPVTAERERNLDALHEEIDRCLLCREKGLAIGKLVGTERGRVGAPVMTIGIGPGAAVMRTGKAFAGNSFARLRSWFEEAGFPSSAAALRGALYQTSLNKCVAVPDAELCRARLWRNCSGFLWRQIDIVQPRLVLVLGAEAVVSLFQRPFGAVVGECRSTAHLYENDLFPSTLVEAQWLALPHPSGLSRSMNNAGVRRRVIQALQAELTSIVFQF